MAHFAEIDDNNTVLRVVVVDNADCMVDGHEDEQVGVAYCGLLFGGRWVQTSYSARFRGKFAARGDFYDSVNDVFIAPKPFGSWSLDENFKWKAPVSKPEGFAIWNEQTQNWEQK